MLSEKPLTALAAGKEISWQGCLCGRSHWWLCHQSCWLQVNTQILGFPAQLWAALGHNPLLERAKTSPEQG